ncbi:hypothetical protein HY251_00895 [bacterium]|nr:hypothetical protein [bacterium]
MLGCLGRWVRATFDYNPIFPISALLLLSGVQQLVHEGAIDAGSAGGAVCGVSIVQAYELALLAVALLVLWPRKIAYETTAILIIFGVVRFAPLFLAIGLAVEGQPREAAFLGGGLALLMALQNEAISRKILPGERWELWYDGALYTVAAVGLPLLAHELARGTGASFSHDAARPIQLGAWWGCAVLLAPLALCLPQLGEDAPLFVQGPTATLRSWLARRTGLCLLGLPALLGNALWLGGAAPVPLFLLPLALVAVGVARAVAKAAGAADRPGLAHVPAVLAVGVLLLPLDLLVGRTDFIGRPAALALFLPFAGAALPLLAPGRARSGLRSLALVAGAAPLVLAPSLVAGERYLIVLSVLLVLVGLAKKNERLLAHGAIAALALSAHLTWDGDLGPLRGTGSPRDCARRAADLDRRRRARRRGGGRLPRPAPA